MVHEFSPEPFYGKGLHKYGWVFDIKSGARVPFNDCGKLLVAWCFALECVLGGQDILYPKPNNNLFSWKEILWGMGWIFSRFADSYFLQHELLVL
jgi:hypothetical protein